ncbi:MAG: aspartyl protease family protein [Patescibacteria group bacterium]
MRFEYVTEFNSNPNEKAHRRPMLDVVLLHGDKKIKVFALVDSGADDCIFNKDVADALGIDLSKAKRKNYAGISGHTRGWLTDVTLYIEAMPDERLTIPVAFIDSPTVSGLLGQVGFFDAFKIKFERDHGVFEIMRSKK